MVERGMAEFHQVLSSSRHVPDLRAATVLVAEVVGFGTVLALEVRDRVESPPRIARPIEVCDLCGRALGQGRAIELAQMVRTGAWPADAAD